jgi:hypothetical protein
MVTPVEMRLFALDCLRWSDEAHDASQRDLIQQVAHSWMNTAAKLERHVGDDGDLPLGDLRSKLN